MIKQTFAVLAAGLTGMVLFASQASAVPIDGTIRFNGSGSVSTVGATTTVSFSGTATDAPLPPAISGNYSGVPMNTPTVFQPIVFTGLNTLTPSLTAVVSPLWTFTIGAVVYSFDLTSLTTATTAVSPNLSTFTLSGNGVAKITGFDPTFGVFSLQGTGENLSFQFIQASTTANGLAVPDGGSAVALLGLAMIGVEGLRRKLGVFSGLTA